MVEVEFLKSMAGGGGIRAHNFCSRTARQATLWPGLALASTTPLALCSVAVTDLG